MRISFTIKISVLITVLITMVTGLGITIFYLQSKTIIVEDIKRRLLNIGVLTSQTLEEVDRDSITRLRQKILDESKTLDASVESVRNGSCGDNIPINCSTLTPEQRKIMSQSPGFLRLRQRLRSVVQSSEHNLSELLPSPIPILDTLSIADHLVYIQVPIPQAPKHDVSLVIANNDDQSDPIGNLYSSDNYQLFGEPFVSGRAAISKSWYFDEFCSERPCMSAIVPIKNLAGKVIAVIGVDYQLNQEWGALANLRRNAFFVASAVLLAAIILSLLISSMINIPLARLVTGARSLQQREFNKKIPIKSQDEFGYLAVILNKMGDEIDQYAQGLQGLVDNRTAALEAANSYILDLNKKLRKENESLGADLDIALSLLARVLPTSKKTDKVKGFAIGYCSRSSRNLSGDYIDLVNLGDQSFIGIGHVSEDGLETGIFNLMMFSALRTLLISGVPMQQCLQKVNQLAFDMTQQLDIDKHMSLTLVSMEENGEVQISGQNEDVLIVRETGNIDILDTVALGFPLGLVADIESFSARLRVHLQGLDTMVLFTSGVVETQSDEGQILGIDFISQLVKDNFNESVVDIAQRIDASLKEHIDDEKLCHDQTCVLIRKSA